jgi:hypothetical protein
MPEKLDNDLGRTVAADREVRRISKFFGQSLNMLRIPAPNLPGDRWPEAAEAEVRKQRMRGQCVNAAALLRGACGFF